MSFMSTSRGQKSWGKELQISIWGYGPWYSMKYHIHNQLRGFLQVFLSWLRPGQTFLCDLRLEMVSSACWNLYYNQKTKLSNISKLVQLRTFMNELDISEENKTQTRVNHNFIAPLMYSWNLHTYMYQLVVK